MLKMEPNSGGSKTRAEMLFDQVIGRPKSPKNYLKDKTNIKGAKTYASGSTRKLTDFRVESILEKREKNDKTVKSDQENQISPDEPLSTRSRKKSSPHPSSVSHHNTRSRRAKALISSSSKGSTAIKCSEKTKVINRGPRIPFTPQQIQMLEEKFELTNYLSSQEVSELSRKLNIPENRVKIWFQNRRARRKREAKSISESSEVTQVSKLESTCRDLSQISDEDSSIQN